MTAKSSIDADAIREAAFVAWCESANYAADDRDAPHVEAFFGGYDAAAARVEADLDAVSRLCDALRAERDRAEMLLAEALRRVTHNFELAVAGKPVRDMAETLAEVKDALAGPAAVAEKTP